MENLIGKKATIAVQGYDEKGLFLGEPVEIVDQKQVEHDLIGRRLAVKVRSLLRDEYEPAWIDKRDLVLIRD